MAIIVGETRGPDLDVLPLESSPPRLSRLRAAYGFDDVAIVPGVETIHPDDVDSSWELAGHRLPTPFVASAMDGVVDVSFAIALGRLGGLAVLNLEGLQTRYEEPAEPLAEIAAAPPETVTELMQRLYQAPIREHLVGQRVQDIKAGGVLAAVSATPSAAERLGPIAAEAGVDVVVVQSTVTSRRFRARAGTHMLDFTRFCRALPVPVVVGNCVGYAAALELLETGVAGLLVGVGPGAACTSREVLGIGVPQVTATLDCAAARDAYARRSGRYVPIITDGGMRTGGDICKAFASGADAVMIGSPFAQTAEAPGRGHHWGMAAPHPGLPRGTRISVGIAGSLEQLLFGPTRLTNGTQNLVGALRTCMGVCGAATLAEMHGVEMVVAPTIKTEGKSWQLAGRL
ncbi:MAG: GuaB3 family IMP dehydrogenase-related protein [Chloroflexota bacterium]|nr:GuaB3 family IMP dehydrogenase-related protein [Chloroflexota bacterium]